MSLPPPIFANFAAEYARMGLAVFPLIPKSKFPFKGSHGELDATSDLIEVARMATGVPEANIAVAPGASGLFVVDEDPRNGGDKTLAALPPLPVTLTTNTGGGGRQYWFVRPAALNDITCTSIGLGIDIKGVCSGYVVAPPSIHPNGRAYEWANDASIAEAPEWLVQKILTSGKERRVHTALSAPMAAEGFLLGRAFEKMGWLGAQIKNGVFAVRCPNEAEHSSGKTFDSSTVIFADEDGGIGTFHCSHAHCVGLGKRILSYFPVGLITDRDCTELATKLKETDLGNAERLGLRYGRKIRYCEPLRTWFVWDGRRWKEDNAQMQEMAKTSARKIWEEINVLVATLLEDDEEDKRQKRRAAHAKTSEGAPRIAAAISLATSAHSVSVDELDSDPWLLNAPNGTVDLRTGWLRPHQQENVITKMTACDYDPDAQSVLWDTFLATVTGGDTELAAYIQRTIGYALVGEALEKAFWFVYGPPDGAKSTFMAAISTMLGDYHVASDADTWLARPQIGGNRGDVVRLRGARLVTSVEIKKGSKFDEQLIKAVTGGDPITQAAKYKDEVTFRPTFSLWFAANDCPAIRDDDEGMWKRVRRVPFTTVIPKDQQDPTMRRRLQEPDVQRAILAWAVRGCLAWQRDGIDTCRAVERSSEEYRAENDELGEFFESNCVFEPGAEVQKAALHAQYEFWARTGSQKSFTAREFAGRVRARSGIGEKKLHGVRLWTGVRLASAGEMVGFRSGSSPKLLS